MGRLKREGNPPIGQLASPVPQAWDPVIEDYARITGQNLGNSRFGADSLQWGKTSDGLYVPIKVDSEGRQEVTLSGTRFELIKEHIGIKIRGGEYSEYVGETISPASVLDVSNHKDLAIVVRNTGEGAIRVFAIRLFSKLNTSNLISSQTSDTPWIVPAGARLVLDSSIIPQLRGMAVGMQVLFYQSGGPSSTVTVEFLGVKRG